MKLLLERRSDPLRHAFGEFTNATVSRLRQAVRGLAASPAFTLPAVATLALGLGALFAVWTMIESVILRPLPYPGAEELVYLDHSAPGIGAEEGLGFTPGIFRHVRERSTTIAAAAAWGVDSVTLSTAEGIPERLRASRITPSLVDVLRVAPRHGRWLMEEDDEERLVVLSHRLWTRSFGADAGVVGRTVTIDREAHRVIGVMPEVFAFPAPDVELWLPLRIDETTEFGGFWLEAVARRAPGASNGDVLAEARELFPRLPETYPERAALVSNLIETARFSPLVIPLDTHVLGGIEKVLWTLLAAVGLVLIIAAGNVGNLFVVRSESRRRERALRRALGAGRRELYLGSLAESLAVVGAGALLAFGLAAVAVQSLKAWGPVDLPRLDEVAVRPTTVGVGMVVALVVSLALAIPTAFGQARNPASELASGARGSTLGRRSVRARQLLIALQMALALVLTVGCGLLLRTFDELRRLEPGFRVADDIATFRVDLDHQSHPGRERAAAFYDRLSQRLEELPGVGEIGLVSCLPLGGWCGGDPLQVEGRPLAPNDIPPIVAVRRAGLDYFSAMGIELVAGRSLERRDHEHGLPVVVISETLARLYFPDEDPLGRKVRPPTGSGEPHAWHTVVGVVGDVPARVLENPADPLIYFPLAGEGFRGVSSHSLQVVLSGVPGFDLEPVVRDLVRELDPHAPVSGVTTSRDLVRDAMARLTFTMLLLILTAAIALALGAVGLYGVASYLIGRRRSEIGVRMALGARAADVRWMVLKEGTAVALVGLATGTVLALGTGRFLSSWLYGVAPADPSTLAVSGGVLLAVALLAVALPARRAARVDPARALRPDA